MDAAERVGRWRRGRARVEGDRVVLGARSVDLRDKLRRAYAWIAEHAIHCPYRDIELGRPIEVGAGVVVRLHEGESFASFILLPLLNLIAGRRMVFVGGPGRGKTTVATLMGLLAGTPLSEVRRAIQHGHPQLTNADLLGSPLPSALVRAESAEEIEVAWRHWLSRRVKIVDEYNRIPTKTQSALLSLLADGYAEMYEQIVECGPSAWYLTANDDVGGGTFEVIEALRDRIDLVVRCTPFHASFLAPLTARLERDEPLLVPADIVLDDRELREIDREVRAIPVPAEVLEVAGFLLGQLDFCRRASDRVEYMNKDTLHLAGRRVGHVCNEDCPLDKDAHLCTQTEGGVSARAYQSLLHFAKALAWFRGASAVGHEDLRELLPWVLHDKLKPNLQSPFFESAEHKVLLVDRVSWIRRLYERSLVMSAAYREVHDGVVRLGRRAESAKDPVAARRELEAGIESLLRDHELNGAVHQDLVLLKGVYAKLAEKGR